MSDSAESSTAQPGPLRYRDDLEQPRPDEEQVVDKIIKVLHGNNEYAYNKYKHGIRDAHAKSHAILRGELTVADGLPAELAQGLFATPASYQVIARLSSTSGALRSDRIRGVHGLGIKVLGVHGPRALPDDDATTQDFILVTHREFPFADVKAYYTRGMPLAWALARLSDPALGLICDLLAGASRLMRPMGLSFPSAFESFIEDNTHILGQTFYSSAPLRYGDYVAKVEYVPLSKSVTDLVGQRLPRNAGKDAYRELVTDFFATNTAEYELRVQLCTDPVRMPIENATTPWPEQLSPHRRVATIILAQIENHRARCRAPGKLAKDPAVMTEVDQEVQEGQAERVNSTPTMLIIHGAKKYPIAGGLNYNLLRSFLDGLTK